MLQILIKTASEYSLSEMAQMAMEAGASWLVLDLPDDIEGLRDEISDIVTMCREGGIILTVADKPEIAKEYGIHGVFLRHGQNPVQLRETLGPEAIIGALVASADTVPALEKADIDYAAVEPSASSADMIGELRNAGCKLPVVAYVPDLKPDIEAVGKLLDAGFSGICAGCEFFRNDKPVATIEALLKRL